MNRATKRERERERKETDLSFVEHEDLDENHWEIKPTYGRVSRFGLLAYASSLDVIGCLVSTVADAGILLYAISGYDKFDSTSSKQDVPDFQSQFLSLDLFESKPLKGVKVGIIR